VLTFLAHCGANWKYCDGGSAVVLVLIAVGVIWAGKRAERKARERRAAFAAARGYGDEQQQATQQQQRRRRRRRPQS